MKTVQVFVKIPWGNQTYAISVKVLSTQALFFNFYGI